MARVENVKILQETRFVAASYWTLYNDSAFYVF